MYSVQHVVSYVVDRMDSLQLKRRRIQQAYEDAEVNEEFEQEAANENVKLNISTWLPFI